MDNETLTTIVGMICGAVCFVAFMWMLKEK
jgi:hypothetical protein